MSYYENTNEEFGGQGPFEAESREALADEMQESFQIWINERWDKIYLEDRPDNEEQWKQVTLAQMRSDFIQGLVKLD